MTLSDKIRIYELSRDLNLDNKDILDAANKLSINVKSHSSSISLLDASKIKNHLNKNKNSGKNILAVNKSTSTSPASSKQKQTPKSNILNKSTSKSQITNSPKSLSVSKPLLIKPTNKDRNSSVNANIDNSKKNEIVNPPRAHSNNKTESFKNQFPKDDSNNKKNQNNSLNNRIKKPNIQSLNPPRPPIQLIEKPKNLNNNQPKRTTTNKVNNSKNEKYNNPYKSNKNDDNSLNNKPQKSKLNTPELVGAPIRRDSNFNKQGNSLKQGSDNRSFTPNRPGSPNKPNIASRTGSPNRQGGANRPGIPSRPGSLNRQGGGNRSGVPSRSGNFNRKGDLNRNNPKFNKPNPSGIRKPVAPNELMQLQKTRPSNEGKSNQVNNKDKQKSLNTPKHKPKAPPNRPNTIAPSKKGLHRTGSPVKKSGKTDWDDSAKLDALRNKSPQKQRQKVHIIGENDESLTTETSGFAGEQKTSILSASLARPKKVKAGKEATSKPSKQLKKKKKETTRQRQKRRAMELRASREAKQVRPEMIIVPEDNLTVQELADKLKLESSEIIKSLFFKGITATVTQSLDLATIETVAEEFGVPVLQDDIEEAAAKTVDMIEKTDRDNLITRPPVVTVMGHVDHGKTSLLDSIRKSRVASGEAGGITQHIGAYQVEVNHENKKRKLTFLDTPGHAAFTAMRARGTKVTDVAVLVVAADDGVRPQTLEAISHARAAKVPIVVAINKIDKEGASADRVKQELSEKELIAEDWGGDIVMVPVSAIKGENIDKLLEMILLVSEVEDLQANPERLARGTVIEAHLDKAKGPVATLLIQNGTLKSGDVLAAGSVLGRIRAMVDEHGNRIKEAAPSFPVEALGFSEVPTAGDEFEVYPDEKTARAIVGERASDARATKLAQQMASRRVSLSSLSNKANEGELKELNLILKADVQGSVEAILGSLEQLPKNEVQVRVLFSAPGEITETDIDLAAASGSVIIGFNTTMASGAKRAADSNNVDIREYEVIYKLLEDIQSAMEGLLEPDLVEEELGEAQVRAVFTIGKGTIAGCYVQNGKLQRNSSLRVRRDNEIVYEGNLDSLKRSKDDVKEVNTGFECGVGCDKFSNWSEGDIIEAYKLVTQKRTLST